MRASRRRWRGAPQHEAGLFCQERNHLILRCAPKARHEGRSVAGAAICLPLTIFSHNPRRVRCSTRLASVMARQPPQKRIIAAHQRFFLRPRPAFELAFCRDLILDAIEFLMKDELYRPAKCRIAVKSSRLMLRNAVIERSAGGPHVVALIATSKDVDVRSQAGRPLRPTSYNALAALARVIACA